MRVVCRALCSAFIVLYCVGCASIYSYPVLGVIEQKEVFLAEGDIEGTYAFQMYAAQYKDERARILYLINLCRYSGLDFCRNNTVYTGENAARWLEYKWDRYYTDVGTVSDFIDNVASRSESSGKDYFLVLPDGALCPFARVLENELGRLEAHERSNAKGKKKRAAEAVQEDERQVTEDARKESETEVASIFSDQGESAGQDDMQTEADVVIEQAEAEITGEQV